MKRWSSGRVSNAAKHGDIFPAQYVCFNSGTPAVNVLRVNRSHASSLTKWREKWSVKHFVYFSGFLQSVPTLTIQDVYIVNQSSVLTTGILHQLPRLPPFAAYALISSSIFLSESIEYCSIFLFSLEYKAVLLENQCQ